MYEEFHGFSEAPFSLTPDTRFFYQSEAHARSFELLKYCISRGEGFLAVYGESGTGKTTLCETLLNEFSKDACIAVLPNPFLSETDLIRSILDSFGALSAKDTRQDRTATASDLISDLHQFLWSLARRDGRALVLIDRAHEMPAATLEQLRVLSNLETATRKMLQIILVGHPELEDLLARPELRQLNQRISLKCEIHPLALSETAAYIQYRMSVVSNGPSRVSFTAEAIKVVYQYSKGVPRWINRMCDRSLFACMLAGTHKVDGKQARLALKELEQPQFGKKLRPTSSAGNHSVWTLTAIVAGVGIVLAAAAWALHSVGIIR